MILHETKKGAVLLEQSDLVKGGGSNFSNDIWLVRSISVCYLSTWGSNDVKMWLQWGYNDDIMMLQWGYKEVTMMI